MSPCIIVSVSSTPLLCICWLVFFLEFDLSLVQMRNPCTNGPALACVLYASLHTLPTNASCMCCYWKKKCSNFSQPDNLQQFQMAACLSTPLDFRENKGRVQDFHSHGCSYYNIHSNPIASCSRVFPKIHPNKGHVETENILTTFDDISFFVILMVDHRSILLFPFATVFVPRLSLNYYLICGNRISVCYA